MRARTFTARLAACILAGTVVARSSETNAIRGADQKNGDSHQEGGKGIEAIGPHWDRLRAEYATLSEPLLEALEQTERTHLALSDNLDSERKAEAAYEVAKTYREIAEIDLASHTETIDSKAQYARNEVAYAEGLVKRAEGRLKRVKSARQQIATLAAGRDHPRNAVDVSVELLIERADEDQVLELSQAEFALEKAKLDLDVLTRFEQKKRTLELKSVIEMKRSAELSRQSEWDLAKHQASGAKRAALQSSMSSEKRQVLAVLAFAARLFTPETTSIREPDKFQRFLEQFESKLAEARPLAQRAREKREEARFIRTSSRLAAEQRRLNGH